MSDGGCLEGERRGASRSGTRLAAVLSKGPQYHPAKALPHLTDRGGAGRLVCVLLSEARAGGSGALMLITQGNQGAVGKSLGDWYAMGVIGKRLESLYGAGPTVEWLACCRLAAVLLGRGGVGRAGGDRLGRGRRR